MRHTLTQIIAAVLFSQVATFAHARGDVNVDVSLSGQVAPGVYGRVNVGNTPPPLVYPQPVVIVRQPQPVAVAPLYMHVPPGHAKKWGKHCHRYHACNRPVYFVRSAEYEFKGRRGHHDRGHHDRDHHDRDRHGHGHKHGHGRD